jgi:hypothetical protein
MYIIFHHKNIITQFSIHSIASHEKINYYMRMVIRSRLNGARAACLLLGLSFFSHLIPAQDAYANFVPVPGDLRRPERGEAPRYPEDLVIGELGQGEAPLGAYQFAQELLSALVSGRNTAAVVQRSSAFIGESVFEELRNINTRSYRIGGGRYEPDGSVSFLVRFIGRTESIIGELFVRYETPRPTAAVEDAEEDEEDEEDAAPAPPAPQEGARWLLDDLMLEEKIPLSDIRDTYRYDFSPYERFY